MQPRPSQPSESEARWREYSQRCLWWLLSSVYFYRTKPAPSQEGVFLCIHPTTGGCHTTQRGGGIPPPLRGASPPQGELPLESPYLPLSRTPSVGQLSTASRGVSQPKQRAAAAMRLSQPMSSACHFIIHYAGRLSTGKICFLFFLYPYK